MALSIATCPETADAFRGLEDVVSAFIAAHPDSRACDMTPSTTLFLPFLTSPEPPAWPAVQKALLQRFGDTRQSRQNGVDPGQAGITTVLAVLARTVVAEDANCVKAVDGWLSWLELAVGQRLNEIRNLEDGSKPAQSSNPSYGLSDPKANDSPTPVKLVSNPSGNLPQPRVSLPASGAAQRSTPAEPTMTTTMGTSTPIDRSLTSTPAQESTLAQEKLSASAAFAHAVRLRLSQAVAGDFSSTNDNGTAFDGNDGRETSNRNDNVEEDDSTAATASPRRRSLRAKPAHQAGETAEREFATTMTSSAPARRAANNAASARHQNPATICMGTSKGVFRSHCHFIAIKPEQNVCQPDVSALGEPIVVITSMSKCDEFSTAFARSRPMNNGSERKGINVFVKRAENEWIYRGIYEIAFDGSDLHALRLLPGPDAAARIPEEIRTAVESRIDSKDERAKKQPMLKGWGWQFPGRTNWSPKAQSKGREDMKAALWTELEETDIKPRLSFLVLRCIGFSQADYAVWRSPLQR
ncbi:hypothetical protein JCM10908_006461 [Rhodotorula pacifica]|uniref:uncharacterized protein n=1 Tax=Rhodotorula pacifica TaxID=1495444 RepID=UPI00317998AA